MNTKIIFILVIFIIFVIFTIIYIKYKNEIKQAYNYLDSLNSNILNTSCGKLEYICQGDGVPVLVIHGIAGGCDQALQTGIGLVGIDYMLLGVSRFGYLKSSLPAESTPQKQAYVYKELLDHLGIEKTVVLATSAGGAPALKFALDYPERTKALILVSSGAPTKEEIKGPTGPPHFIINDFIFWFMLNNMDSVMFSMFGISKEAYNNALPEEKEEVDNLFKTLLPIEPRKHGMINDEKITNLDMINNYDSYELEKITVPTLIFHAKNDPMASFKNAKEMAARIPGAKFIEFEDGGHILFGHGKKIRKIIEEFFQTH